MNKLSPRTPKPIKTFKATIVRTIVTEFTVYAASPYAARKQVMDYGISEAAVDYASQDTNMTAWIKSIKAIDGPK